MRKLLVIAFVIVGTATFAQVKSEGSADVKTTQSGNMIEWQSQKMKTDLDLNEEQTTQIKAWIAKQEQDREAIRAELRALKVDGRALTSVERDGIKTKKDAQKASAANQLKAILTPEQYAKMQTMGPTRKAEVEKTAPKALPVG